MKTLDPKNLGLALGSTMALGLALLSIISLFDGNYGNTIISIISSVYLGYDNTIPGAVIGAIWGFIDGLIGGYIFAWLYNRFSEK